MAALFVLLLFLLVVAVQLWRSSRASAVTSAPKPLPPMRADAPTPQGVFLHDGHSWARLTPDGVVRVGIDRFLAEALGDAESVELPPRGTSTRRGEPLFRVKAHGRWLDVPSPVDGEVVSTHGDVATAPWSVTLDPYGVGWAVALHSRAIGSIKELRTGTQANAFIRDELKALVEFLSRSTRVGQQPVFADAGVPPKGVTAALDDKSWAGFCQRFVRSGQPGSDAQS